MTIASFLSTVGLILKFWDQVTWIVKRLEKTPEQKREELMTSIRKEADQYAETGRPSWT